MKAMRRESDAAEATAVRLFLWAGMLTTLTCTGLALWSMAQSILR